MNLLRVERLTASEQREGAGEDDADGERREEIGRPVAVAEPEERTGDHVGGVLDAQEDDCDLIDEEDREGQAEVDPRAGAVAEAIIRGVRDARGRHGLRHNANNSPRRAGHSVEVERAEGAILREASNSSTEFRESWGVVSELS